MAAHLSASTSKQIPARWFGRPLDAAPIEARRRANDGSHDSRPDRAIHGHPDTSVHLQGALRSLDIFWSLPTTGDTRYLGKSDSGRAPTNGYMRQIAVTAEELGYDGLLIPTGSNCLDPWITAASLVPVTRRIKLLVALRTSAGSPTLIARQAATLDQALR